MAYVSPDTSPRLKPDFIKVVHTIYADMCHLTPGERVLILSDAKTPADMVAVFQGMAMTLGGDAVVMESPVPAGGPTYQPDAKWSPMVVAATTQADLIIDLAIGYTDFIAEAVERGARVMMPSDGVGCPYLDDMLIRTLRDVDIHDIRRAADRIADRFTEASTCTLITGEGDELVVDIRGLDGVAADGFLWDADKQDWKSKYAILPPAQPGVAIPKGRVNGTVTVDGTFLWHPIYHEQPDRPIRLTYDNSRLVRMEGNSYLANRIWHWLEEMDDADAWCGPNHLNIGINPNALVTQNQEWERVYGSVTCGMGDMRMLSRIMADSTLAWPVSRVHWDWTVLQPKILLDGKRLAERGRIEGGPRMRMA